MRFGNRILKDKFMGRFFAIAVYFTDDFKAERYIMYQRKQEKVGINGEINVC